MLTATLPASETAVRDTMPPPPAPDTLRPAPAPTCGLPCLGGCCTRHPDHGGECNPNGEPTEPALPEDDEDEVDLAEPTFRCASTIVCPTCLGDKRLLKGLDRCIACPTCAGEGAVFA